MYVLLCIGLDDCDNELGSSGGENDDNEHSLLVYRDHSNRR